CERRPRRGQKPRWEGSRNTSGYPPCPRPSIQPPTGGSGQAEESPPAPLEDLPTQVSGLELGLGVGQGGPVEAHASLLQQPPRLGVGGGEPGRHEQATEPHPAAL